MGVVSVTIWREFVLVVTVLPVGKVSLMERIVEPHSTRIERQSAYKILVTAMVNIVFTTVSLDSELATQYRCRDSRASGLGFLGREIRDVVGRCTRPCPRYSALSAFLTSLHIGAEADVTRHVQPVQEAGRRWWLFANSFGMPFGSRLG